MWAQQSVLSSGGRGKFSGVGEQISRGGQRAIGFGVAAAGDPDVWAKLSADQQAWVGATLSKLNDLIVKTTGTTCPGWAPAIPAASKCFQPWYNSMYAGSPGFVQLRTDGVFDADTLQALQTTALIHQADFPTPFPGTAPTTAVEKKGLSTGAMVGIAAAAATALGGGIYVATRKTGKKRR